MSNPRDTIFATIKRNKPKPVKPPKHIVPVNGCLQDKALFERFCAKVISSAATLATLDQLDQVPSAIASHLKSLDAKTYQPTDSIFVNHPNLTGLNWQNAGLHCSSDPAHYNSKVCIALSPLGIAETGSIVLQSAPKVSSAAFFLADLLIVVIFKRHLVASQEAVWQNIDKDNGIARTITLATGPSRTGDIEQKLVIGAHGPRHEHILIINN